MGFLLDNKPGELGHQLLFGVMVIFGLIGIVASWLFTKSVNSTRLQE